MNSATLPHPDRSRSFVLSQTFDEDEKWPLRWTLLVIATSSTALWSAIILTGWYLL